jgi:hypothetical protein
MELGKGVATVPLIVSVRAWSRRIVANVILHAGLPADVQNGSFVFPDISFSLYPIFLLK